MSIDERLLVPVHLDCLVVNQHMVAGQQLEGGRIAWKRPLAQYEKLQRLHSPAPGVDDLGSEPEIGVHLHWALPDALTRGRERERGSGKVEFPHVPNRWLVLRVGPADPDSPRLWKAWVVESDHLGSEGRSPFVDPWEGADGTPPRATRLGRIHLLHPAPDDGTGWRGDPQPVLGADKSPFLRAVGPGDLSFAAWQPGVEGVFSLHDDLSDVDRADIDLSYTVIGWFSDPVLDPLHGLDAEGFARRLREYQWSLDGAVPESPPGALLCHATRFAVRWQKTSTPPRPNLEESEWVRKLQVGVGHTAIDGLAAILEARAQGAEAPAAAGALVAELFEAAQYDALATLDEPGGKVRLDHQIRDHWFGSHPGGVRWELIAAERGDGDKAPPPPLSAKQEKWLAALNCDQRQFDAARRKLESLQEQLYALWWKRQKTKNWADQEWGARFAGDFPQLAELLQAAKSAVAAQQEVVKERAQKVPDLAAAWACRQPRTEGAQPADAVAAAVAEWLDGQQHSLPPGLQLKPHAAPRFWHPTDPVVVVSGLARARKHGEDGRHRDDGTLLCRLARQAVTSLSGHEDAPLKGRIPLPTGSGIPDLTSLLSEAFILDPANASDLGVGQETVRSLGSASATTPCALLPKGAVPPSPMGLAAWEQAWAPLFLHWKVAYYPTAVTTGYPPYGLDRERWQFSALVDGTAASGAAEYRYHEDSHALRHYVDINGRTFLTPQAEYRFAEQITRYVRAHPPEGIEEAKVEAFLAQLGDLDVLSQTLSGFNERLIMRQAQSNLPPGADVAAAVGDRYHAVPNPDDGAVDPGKPYFFPVRGGFFHFKELSVVDAFGQSVDLLYGNGNVQAEHRQEKWPGFRPCRGRGMIPAGQGPTFSDLVAPRPDPGAVMVLPPRVVQAARLDFRLLDGRAEAAPADTDVDEYGLVAGAQPVCGWLVANHLDQALAVHDSDGNLLGELILRTVITGDKAPADAPAVTVDWLPAPAAEQPVDDPRQIANGYLRAFVSTLLDHPDAGKAFENLLEVIDSTLWTVDPLGGRSDQNLSVLIGRPLALVRARLRLELQGDPVRDQSWDWDFVDQRPEQSDIDETSRRERQRALTAGFTDLEFDVRLGDPELRNDGLMGYYEGQDFSCLHAVHRLEQAPAQPRYVAPIEDGAYLQLSLREDDCKLVTMLLDPRGAVHAATGLLPTKAIELPGRYVEDLLAGLRVTFRAGPLLTEAATIRLPRPAERHGSWGWIERTAPGEWAERPILNLGDEARLADELPVLREGWLQLSEALPKLAYSVSTDPEPLRASREASTEKASLTITATNPGKVALACGGISFVLPLGNGSAALAEDLAGLAVAAKPESWKVSVAGDRVLVTPPPEGIPPGQKFELVLGGLRINQAAGTARIFVVEDTRGRPTASLAVVKTPAGATTGGLTLEK